MKKILAFSKQIGWKNPAITSVKNAVPGSELICAPPDEHMVSVVERELPTMIFMDADPQGIYFCQKIRENARTCHIPIILFKDKPIDYQNRIRALNAGADMFISTRIDPEELKGQVNGLIRIYRALDRIQNENNILKDKINEKTQALNEKSYELNKRVKELNCLYDISVLREKLNIPLEELLQGVTDIIPSSLQYPEITCARILMGYQEFKTANFEETPWKVACDIRVQGEWTGTIEAYYLKRPDIDVDTPPFLKEEGSLLNAIGERLGRIAERFHAEESLRLKSENITNILTSMEDLVYQVNEQYELEYINPALEKEFGEPNGRKCYTYFRNRMHPCSGCRFEEVMAGHTVRRERYFDRNHKVYDVVETPLKNPDGGISKLAIYRDLTPIKQAQKALEERELLYRSVTESAADGAVMVQDGKILFANHALAEMFGYEESSELAGMDAVQLFEKEFRGLFRKVFDPAEHDGNIMNLLRGVCVTKEGNTFWVSTNRRVISLKSKPAILATLRDITEDVLQERSIQEVTEHLRQENIKLKSSIKEIYKFGNIIGKSIPMRNVYELILKAAGSEANVIVLGESGTGKELVARSIHDMSACTDGPFVPVNCGAIPENLVESEFFGHRKGAFTSAHINKTGYLQTADGGTLFLDEVGELGLNIQVKLLRALDLGEYTPVGETRVRKSRTRIISATNRDFQEMLKNGQIREDFYYRISVIPIILPPLRDKKEDIPLLVEHFLKFYCKQGKVPTIPGKIMEALHDYNWPGNVRELQSVIQRYLAVENFDFFKVYNTQVKHFNGVTPKNEKKVTNLKQAVCDFERAFIRTALEENRWHRGNVANALGIDPKTLYMKMKKAGLN